MAAAHQGIELDLESLGTALGPAGLHAFLDQAIVQPVLQQEAEAEARQQRIGARTNQDAAISPKGLFAIEERFDAFAFHDIVQAEGRESLEEGDLIRDLRRKHSSIVVRSRSRRSSIIVPATRYTRLPARDAARIIATRPGRLTLRLP